MEQQQQQHQLSQVEMGQFCAAFKRYSSLGEEVIRVSDIPNVITSLGITPSHQQIQNVINKVNDGTRTDGTINFKNFLSAISSNETILRDILIVIAGLNIENTNNKKENHSPENKENVEHEEQLSEQELREAFQFCDKDGNGFITADEVRQVMAGFGEMLSLEEINEKMEEADADGDGKINYEEFINICRGGDTLLL
ncbi:unnamed protein product [Meganyctiphanes norvegica]|uniref:EF-hand domain-containing protein n=1 Tax=Meganyctiphanes norvegica TaxID=48144 RepID=A0AAV2PVH3_MEGNR